MAAFSYAVRLAEFHFPSSAFRKSRYMVYVERASFGARANLCAGVVARSLRRGVSETCLPTWQTRVCQATFGGIRDCVAKIGGGSPYRSSVSLRLSTTHQ